MIKALCIQPHISIENKYIFPITGYRFIGTIYDSVLLSLNKDRSYFPSSATPASSSTGKNSNYLPLTFPTILMTATTYGGKYYCEPVIRYMLELKYRRCLEMILKSIPCLAFLCFIMVSINLSPLPCFSRLLGDINEDEAIDLIETMYALQISAGIQPPAPENGGDINEDGKINVAEAVYALQVTAGIRSPISETFGEPHTGQYHLGPVDFAETDWHNGCAPNDGYRSELYDSVGLGGEYIAGVSNFYNQGGAVCGRCIRIITATGRSITARVVTYGITQPEDLDVSPSIYAALNIDEYPRTMTWQFVRCPEAGPLLYEFHPDGHQWWSSLWIRNARIPIEKVEVKSANHPQFFTLTVQNNGTYVDFNGFGAGQFTIRVTAIDGQVIENTFSSFPSGELISSETQFQ
jgi:expansin